MDIKTSTTFKRDNLRGIIKDCKRGLTTLGDLLNTLTSLQKKAAVEKTTAASN